MSKVTIHKGKLRKGTPNSAGYDLFAAQDAFITIRGRVNVPVGIFSSMAEGVVGIIKDRSGLANNNGVTTMAGVIDGDFPDEWGVILQNNGNHPFVIKKGDRIAQVVFVDSIHDIELGPNAEIVYGKEERIGGFGSTGV